MSLKEMAAETLAIVEVGGYSVSGRRVNFGAQQQAAMENTRLYRPSELEALRSQAAKGPAGEISVVDGTAQVIACGMAKQAGGSLGLLNFASARNPGGGFLNGAKAQEEDICRCSGLYPCLLKCMEYYEANRQNDSLLYTDHAIYSPNVPFFKSRSTGELLQEPFYVSVITAPAPNSGPYLRGNRNGIRQLEQTFVRRWEIVLCIARASGIRRLILGAWGCGAFGGDPVMASATAKQAIERSGLNIDKIVFAIPRAGAQSQANLKAFRAAFS